MRIEMSAVRRGTTLVVLLCSISLSAQTLKLEELVGHWADAKWAEELERSRSPIGAANLEPPAAFSLELTNKGWFRLSIANFHEATWRVAYEIDDGALVVGPLEQEPSADAKQERIPLTITRDSSAHLASVTGALWPGEPAARFRRLPENVERWSRSVVLAGDYIEGASSRRWSFGVDGSVSRPDHSSEKYELNLDPSEACCDWLTIGEKRIGFAWHEGVLRLYEMVESEDCPISCAKESFVTLVPRKTRPWSGAGAAAALRAPNRLMNVDVVAEPGSKGEWYVARGAGVEVRLSNVTHDAHPDGFNEPPFLIRAKGHSKPCKAISTNAMREGVWISADGKRVGFATWSGSSTGFDLFDAGSCRRVGSIDASGGLAVSGTILTTDPACEPMTETTAHCTPAAIYHLTSAGTLELMPEQSRERTKAMLGVGIDRAADIEWPYTSKARVMSTR